MTGVLTDSCSLSQKGSRCCEGEDVSRRVWYPGRPFSSVVGTVRDGTWLRPPLPRAAVGCILLHQMGSAQTSAPEPRGCCFIELSFSSHCFILICSAPAGISLCILSLCLLSTLGRTKHRSRPFAPLCSSTVHRVYPACLSFPVHPLLFVCVSGQGNPTSFLRPRVGGMTCFSRRLYLRGPF